MMEDYTLVPATPLSASERNGVYRAILTRRDTRGAFLPDPVPDELLSRRLVAVHHAPSVGYMEPWSFLVIRDVGVKRQVHNAFLKAHAEAALMFPEAKRGVYSKRKLEGIMDAPINICITCDRDRAGPTVIGRTYIRSMDLYSSVCAVQNLWLAARAEGLGVGWVSIFDNGTVQRILNIPKRIVLIAHLCLGKVSGFHRHPELETAGWRQRLPLDQFVHFDVCGHQETGAGLQSLDCETISTRRRPALSREHNTRTATGPIAPGSEMIPFHTVDVLVIGGGSAALCAAIAARRNGVSVYLIEQAPAALRGGNTRHARNFRLMHDQPTRYVQGTYPEEAFFLDLVRVTRGATDERLARLLVRGSATIAEWLVGNGVRMQNPATSVIPHSQRTAFLLGGGKAMVNALYTTAARLGVTISYENELVGIDFEDDRKCHATIVHRGNIKRIMARVAVVCSGGHQANLDWLREDIGSAADGFMVRGTPYATGAVLRLLLDAGVRAVGSPSLCHMVAVDARGPKFDGGIVTRITAIPHGIVVDRNGARFADEGEDVSKTHFARWGAHIAECPGQIAYLIMDAMGLARALPTALPPIQADTVAALAAKLRLDPVALENTIRKFNTAIAVSDNVSLIDRSETPLAPPKSRGAAPLVTPPFACYPLRPGVTFTHFGVAVDDSMRVLKNDGRPAMQIFAAGMIMAANVLSEGYLSGLGVTISTVFGRLAGEAATRRVRK